MTPDLSHELDLESVFEAVGTEAEMEALAVQGMLEGSGLSAVLVGSSSLPTLPFQVCVPRDQAEAARKRIEEARAAGPAGAAEAEEAAEAPVARAPGLVTTTVPVLPSLDLDETIAFYKMLGFVLASRFGDDYAIVHRDGVQIHFWACDDKEVARNSGCYVRTPDAKALHEEFATSGVDCLSDMEVKPWQMLEFSVIDPSGNLVRFGQPAAGGS